MPRVAWGNENEAPLQNRGSELSSGLSDQSVIDYWKERGYNPHGQGIASEEEIHWQRIRQERTRRPPVLQVRDVRSAHMHAREHAAGHREDGLQSCPQIGGCEKCASPKPEAWSCADINRNRMMQSSVTFGDLREAVHTVRSEYSNADEWSHATDKLCRRFLDTHQAHHEAQESAGWRTRPGLHSPETVPRAWGTFLESKSPTEHLKGYGVRPRY